MTEKSPSRNKNGLETVATGISVMVRCRPFNKREKEWFQKNGREEKSILHFEGKTVTVLDPENDYVPKDAFAYHQCHWSCTDHESVNGFSTQQDVYATSGSLLLERALEGYNGTVFAYGQTGSGKTYSMLGGPGNPGISYLLIRDLFQRIDEAQDTKFSVHISFMEIYNEQVRDLFCKKSKAGEYKPVKIRQHPVLGIQVEGLEQLNVASAAECEKTMERGVNERALAETKMNATSSRSHAICQISIMQANADTGLRRNSVLNVVDLAGSERLKMSGATGVQLVEAKNINQSLSTLRKVFDVLIDNSKKKTKAVPPYRESMLTWVLKESLGGNSITTMIAAVSPCEENIEDTYSTLRYAQKAKAIVCKVIHNEQPNAKMVSNLKDQVEELQKQLADKTSGEANEETKEEIRQEYENQIKDAEEALIDAEKVQEELESKHEQLESEVKRLREQRSLMTLEVEETRKKNFSAAFRSAFQVCRERRDINRIQDTLKKELVSEREKADTLHKLTEEEKRSLQVKVDVLSSQATQMERDNKDLMEKIRSCCCKALHSEVEQLTDALKVSQTRVANLDQLKKISEDESSQLDRRLRARITEQTRSIEELRVEKDVYKKKYLALSRMHEADTKIIESMVAASSEGVSFASPLLRQIEDRVEISPVPDRESSSSIPRSSFGVRASVSPPGAVAAPRLSAIQRRAQSMPNAHSDAAIPSVTVTKQTPSESGLVNALLDSISSSI